MFLRAEAWKAATRAALKDKVAGVNLAGLSLVVGRRRVD